MANSRQSSAAINEAARLDAEATSLLSDFEPSDIDEYISASQAPAVSPGVPLPTSSPPDSLQTMMLAMIERMSTANAALEAETAARIEAQLARYNAMMDRMTTILQASLQRCCYRD